MTQVIFEPVSNRADWVQQVEVYDQDSNPFDLTGATIIFALYDPKSKQQLLIAQTADGSLTIPAIGLIAFTIPVAKMRGLIIQKQYECGCTALLGGVTQQIFTGSVAVYDGLVP